MKTQFVSPPDDGSRNAVTVFDRVYQSVPGAPIAVPDFDIPTLEANGWVVFVGASLPTTTSAYAPGVVSGVVSSPSGSPAGLAVRLYIDGSASPAGVTVVDGNGNWSVPTGILAAGFHTFSVEIDESAGSFSVGSAGGAGAIYDFSDPNQSGFLILMKAA